MSDNKAVMLRLYEEVFSQGNIDLELWPQFREAVGSPETWTKFLPIGNQPLNRTLTRGRLIFPEEALQKCQQEQIFLEAQNFQGIPFIFLKTLSRTTKGGRLAPANIGPLLWSQFLNSLDKMEETLVEMGWLARKHEAGASRQEHREVERHFASCLRGGRSFC